MDPVIIAYVVVTAAALFFAQRLTVKRATRRTAELERRGLILDEGVFRERIGVAGWMVYSIDFGLGLEYWIAPTSPQIDWSNWSLEGGYRAASDINVSAVCKELGVDINHIIYRRSKR